jgi:alpha-tubulin suppressor-like RCC1 family protein
MSNGRASSLAIKTDGTLWAWGRGSYGSIGDGTLSHRSSPVQIPGNGWINVSSNWFSSLATKCFTG